MVRFFIPQKYFLFSDAVFPKTYPTAVKSFPAEEKTVTKVQTLRIKKDDMEGVWMLAVNMIPPSQRCSTL
jgi:hypothetical protein